MTLDSAWIFRICLCITVLLILFADFFGSGNVADAISDDGGILNTYSIDNNRKSEKDNQQQQKIQQQQEYRKRTKDESENESIDMKLFKKTLSEKQRNEQKKAIDIMQQKLSDSLRDLCLPKLLCEIAAKPSYLLTEKEKHVLSLLKSTSLSIVADSPSVWHFSSHMGQLLRHSADSIGAAPMGCAMLWPNCPYSSDKLMQISTKVRLR